MKAGRLTVALATGVTAMALGAAPAMAKEIKVDDDGVAVQEGGHRRRSKPRCTAAVPGDKIKVCARAPTTSRCRIENKDNLKLEAEKKTKLEQSQAADPTKEAIIKAPSLAAQPSGDKAIVLVRNAHDIDITGFRITGPGVGWCATRSSFGVKVDDGGEAEIDHNRITEIRDNPFSGCQNGVGVQVGRQSESHDRHGRRLTTT